MLSSRRRTAGFSLIELMVVLVLVGFGMTMAVRAFGGFAADGRVRATAETLLNGLRMAQANAIAHNRVTVFALTAGTPSATATPSNSGNNWFFTVIPLAGSDDPAATMVASDTSGRRYNVSIAGSPTLAGASTTGTSAPLCFNSLGQVTTQTTTGLSAACTAPADGLPVIYQVSSATASRSFKVFVYPGGQMRMCDAAKSLSNSNPDGCP